MLKKQKKITMSYSQAIREATHFLLKKNKNFLILGQGVTSPWYVGNSMLNLNNLFPNQVIDTPVSENLITLISLVSLQLSSSNMITKEFFLFWLKFICFLFFRIA